jgi:hypothetical protein
MTRFKGKARILMLRPAERARLIDLVRRQDLMEARMFEPWELGGWRMCGWEWAEVARRADDSEDGAGIFRRHVARLRARRSAARRPGSRPSGG